MMIFPQRLRGSRFQTRRTRFNKMCGKISLSIHHYTPEQVGKGKGVGRFFPASGYGLPHVGSLAYTTGCKCTTLCRYGVSGQCYWVFFHNCSASRRYGCAGCCRMLSNCFSHTFLSAPGAAMRASNPNHWASRRYTPPFSKSEKSRLAAAKSPAPKWACARRERPSCWSLSGNLDSRRSARR